MREKLMKKQEKKRSQHIIYKKSVLNTWTFALALTGLPLFLLPGLPLLGRSGAFSLAASCAGATVSAVGMHFCGGAEGCGTTGSGGGTE